MFNPFDSPQLYNSLQMQLHSLIPQYGSQQLFQQQMILPPNNDCESEDEDDDRKRTLFCGNLDEKVTEDLLYEVFVHGGPIESVKIPKDNSGRNRSFGFVVYKHPVSASFAIQLYQGISLYRKSVTVKYQGDNSPSPTQRRSMPMNIDLYGGRRNDGNANGSYSFDNSALRGSSFNPFRSPDINDNSPHRNPFRSNEPKDRDSNHTSRTQSESSRHNRCNSHEQRRQHSNSAETWRRNRAYR